MPIAFWANTEEKIARLKELWLSGMQASKICKEMGAISRNAVIGMVGRLGIKRETRGENNFDAINKERRIAEKKKERRQLRAEVRKRVEPEEFLCDSALDLDCTVPLMEIESDQCRYIAGNARDALMCGRPTVLGTSWCPGHFRICVRLSTFHVKQSLHGG